MEAVTSLWSLATNAASSAGVDIKILLENESARKRILPALSQSAAGTNTPSSSSSSSSLLWLRKPSTHATTLSPGFNGSVSASTLATAPPLYFDGESVRGKVQIRAKEGKRIEHNGIKVEFVGQIESSHDRSHPNEFVSLVQELATPGELKHTVSFDFEFKNVEKQHESYNGINVRLRYFVRVIIARRLASIQSEKDIWVYSYRMPPEINDSIKMEVGIEDCLHIEFEYNKAKYSLKDVIVGRIYFLLVRIKVRHMELSIIRRESTAPNQYNENETITKFEIMDGAPIRGESIPIRLFLGGFDLSPSFREVNKRFSVRYFLNLVLVDEENRRYFKQQEVTLYRIQEADETPPTPTVV